IGAGDKPRRFAAAEDDQRGGALGSEALAGGVEIGEKLGVEDVDTVTGHVDPEHQRAVGVALDDDAVRLEQRHACPPERTAKTPRAPRKKEKEREEYSSKDSRRIKAT